MRLASTKPVKCHQAATSNLARLIRTNSEYLLQRLPHIAELMVVAEVTDAVDWAETIVVTTTDPIYARAITAARSDQIVLDFAYLNGTNSGDASALGFLW